MKDEFYYLIDTVTAQVDLIHSQIIRSEKSIKILTAEIKAIAEIDQRNFSNTLCFVALAKLTTFQYKTSGSERTISSTYSPDPHQLAMALRLAFTSRSSCDYDDVALAPLWMVDYLRRYAPNSVLSRTYSNFSTDQINTAKSLWQPRTSQQFSAFDQCVASSLLI